MFEYRRLWSSAHRSIALSSLVLLLTLILSGAVVAPAAAQVADGGTTSPSDGSGVPVTGTTTDEWENDILNNPTPDTQAGVVDWLVSLLLESLGLGHGAASTPWQPLQ